MNELCRLRRSERYEVRADEKQEKACASQPHPQTHKSPQCGLFRGVGAWVRNPDLRRQMCQDPAKPREIRIISYHRIQNRGVKRKFEQKNEICPVY